MRLHFWLILLISCYSGQALADFKWRHVFFVPAISSGYSTFSFPKKLDQKITFVNTEFSLTTLYQKLLVSGSISGSMLNETISEEDDIGKAKRRDLDLLAAYQINSQFSVFSGFKYGRTNIAFETRKLKIKSNDLYRQIGPYLGGNYTYKFEKGGKLSLSLAYSYLDALNILHANLDEDDSCDFDTNPKECELDDFSGQIEGKTKGYSLGISWNMALTPRLIYQTKLKTNLYTQNLTHKGNTQNANESFTIFLIGLAYIL